MNRHFAILTLLISFQISGQNATCLKTTDKKQLHYLEFNNKTVTVYKMGRYFDKGGTTPVLLQTDTLNFTGANEYKGKFYSLVKGGANYTLKSTKGKKYETAPESKIKINTELNHAYCLKSYIDLSLKLNEEFPLSHYTFRNGYSAWEKLSTKSIDPKEFIRQTNSEITLLYDSISKKQRAFTITLNYITNNVNQTNYTLLKDSLSTLPLTWRSQHGYFDKSVYQMSKAFPEYFYKLLQDFPSAKTFIYSAVNHDKYLVKQLKQVRGYDSLKKEFLNDYKSQKSMKFRGIAIYAIVIGSIVIAVVRS